MSNAVSVRIELDRFLFRRRVSIVNENRDSDSGSQACLQSSRDQLVGQLKLTSTPRDQSRATSQHQQSSSLRHRKVTNSKSCGMTPAVSRTDRATEMYEFSTFDGEPSAKSDGCDSQAMCVSDTELSLNRDGDDIALAFRNIISRKLVSSHCTRYAYMYMYMHTRARLFRPATSGSVTSVYLATATNIFIWHISCTSCT